MKRIVLLILSILTVLTFSACRKDPQLPIQTTGPVLTAPPSAPESQVSANTHSNLYIPGLEVDDVIRYFNEVCLDAEFTHSGDPSVLQKWDIPIAYMLHGEYTQEDLTVLSEFTQWLNTIEGFPGIYETSDPSDANLAIHFCTKKEMVNLMGDQFRGMDGAVTFWYRDNAIYDAIICYRTDLDQTLRNAVILEEIYNGLGPVADTALRPDSVIYSEFSQPQALSDIDRLLLTLLYNPSLECGMDAAACEEAIRTLYY